MARLFFVYILSSKSRCIYTGVTSNLPKRLEEHKTKAKDGFTKQYKVDRLVYYEFHKTAKEAIDREKQIKRWSRAKKVFLIEKMNPQWDDLVGKTKVFS